MKLEGQIQGLNLYGLEDNKAFYNLHLWMWEYVGVKMKHTQLPKKSGGILVVLMQLSVQMALHSLFFSVLASVRIDERNCGLCGASKNRCLGLFLHKHLSLWRKLQTKDPHKPGIPSLSVSTL